MLAGFKSPGNEAFFVCALEGGGHLPRNVQGVLDKQSDFALRANVIAQRAAIDELHDIEGAVDLAHPAGADLFLYPKNTETAARQDRHGRYCAPACSRCCRL